MRRLRVALGVVALAWGAMACTPGATLFTSADADSPKNKEKPTLPPPPKDANVIAVHVTAQAEPWIGFDHDGVMKVGGVRFSVLLESGASNKSVYGDGTLEITIYHVARGPDGKPRRAVVRKWEYSADDALGSLGRRPKAFGWWYGMRLKWDDVDLTGQEIQIVVRFIRKDSQIVESRPLSLRVPK